MSGDSAIAVLIAVGVDFVMGGTAALWLASVRIYALETALHSIAINTCCTDCREAANVAADALTGGSARRKTPKSAGEA